MRRIRDATQVLAALDRGHLVAEFQEALAATLEEMRTQSLDRPRAKLKGEVRLTLALAVENGAVTITGDIAAKAPKPVRGSTLFWIAEDGALSTEHPDQAEMFGGPREARPAPEPAAEAAE